MKSHNFIKFKNICKKCNHNFDTYSLRDDEYGLVFLSTVENEIIIFDPDENSTWDEVKNIIKNIIINHKINSSLEDELFESAFNHTLDLSSENKKYYLWGSTPCPKCNDFERSYFGPYEPPVIVKLETNCIKQKKWIQLNKENKIKALEKLSLN